MDNSRSGKQQSEGDDRGHQVDFQELLKAQERRNQELLRFQLEMMKLKHQEKMMDILFGHR